MMHKFPSYQIKGKTVEYKTYSFLVKSVDQKLGIATGIASPTTNIDRQKDTVDPGAYVTTLSEAKQRMQGGRRFMMATLWMHNPEQPTGGVIAGQELPNGLEVTMKYDISTNAAGQYNNPVAAMVFSGMDVGFIDELSIGYVPIKYVYDKQGVRHLQEIDLIEISNVTMLFAANPEALVPASGVKSMFAKTASGKTTWPLADRATKWDSGQATKDIEAWADGDWSKVAQCFFWVAKSPPEKLDDCKLPFVAKVGDEMQAIPQGIISCAGVIQGAMGGVDLGGDEDAVKKKITAYYKKMDMTPPWESDDKRRAMTQERKDFNDLYQAAQAADCLEDWGDLVNTLTAAMMQLFCMGDQPAQDMAACLDQFGTAVMDWVDKGMQSGLAAYLSSRGYGGDNTPYVPYSLRVGDSYGYMARHNRPDGKVGRTISAANQNALEEHQAKMNKALDAMGEHMKMMQESVDSLGGLWGNDQGNQGGSEPDDENEEGNDGKGKTWQHRPLRATKDITIDDLAALLA